MNKGVLSGWGQPLTNGAEQTTVLRPSTGASIVLSYTRCRNYVIVANGALLVLVRDWVPAGRLAILTIEYLPSDTTAPTWMPTWKWLTDSNAAPTMTANKRRLITAYTRDGGATVLASASAAES